MEAAFNWVLFFGFFSMAMMGRWGGLTTVALNRILFSPARWGHLIKRRTQRFAWLLLL